MELSFISKLIVMPNGDSNYKSAKQCALIAVDEILKLDMLFIDAETYWKQVKTEINKL